VPNSSKFVKFAAFVLGYNLLVIAWGAFVRLSYSGAGCGNHWPLCNGELLPNIASIETAVEFAHRVSSGLVLPLTIALIVMAWRRFGKAHPATISAWAALVFTCISAIVGMLLVRYEWVGMNDSVARAVTLAAHLINTMLLLGALTKVIWFGSGRPRVRASGIVGLPPSVPPAAHPETAAIPHSPPDQCAPLPAEWAGLRRQSPTYPYVPTRRLRQTAVG
jgi:heme A synthase